MGKLYLINREEITLEQILNYICSYQNINMLREWKDEFNSKEWSEISGRMRFKRDELREFRKYINWRSHFTWKMYTHSPNQIKEFMDEDELAKITYYREYEQVMEKENEYKLYSFKKISTKR